MHERLESIKNHVKNHKTKYVVAGGVVVGAVIGGSVVYFKLSKDHFKHLAVINSASNTFGDVTDSTINIDQSMTTIIDRALGDSGNVIKNLRTGVVYRSQNELSRLEGVSPKTINRYLRGLIPDLHGEQYEVIGKAEEVAKKVLA